MTRTDSAAGVAERSRRGPRRGSGGSAGGLPPRLAVGGGERRLLRQYKPDQGKATRIGTFVGTGAVIAWGGKFVYDLLTVYEGDEWWRLLITTGIPIAFAVLLGGVTWWVVFAHRSTGDFMIATEGEMKKVSWSSKAEIIGSTKVVIMFTILLAILLFVVDLAFQTLFHTIGVLKT